MQYSSRVDQVFGDFYQHRSLRTVFDVDANEWSNTSIQKKAEILERLLQSGYPLTQWIEDYLHYYKSLKKGYVKYSVPRSLNFIKDYVGDKETQDQIIKWLKLNDE